MILKKKKVIIQGHSRDKNQEKTRSDKEMEHGVDISEVNISICAFHRRFEYERMNA